MYLTSCAHTVTMVASLPPCLMSSAHTPGPWHARHDTVRWNVYESDDRCLACLQLPCTEANARLIAAAPELLEACKALLDAKRSGRSQHRTDAAALIYKAEAAIAKAEPRQTGQVAITTDRKCSACSGKQRKERICDACGKCPDCHDANECDRDADTSPDDEYYDR